MGLGGGWGVGPEGPPNVTEGAGQAPPLTGWRPYAYLPCQLAWWFGALGGGGVPQMAAAQSPPVIARLDLSSAHNPENQAGTLNSGRVPLSARRLSKSVLHADSSGGSSNASGIVMLTDSVGTPRAVRVVQKEESEGRNIIRVGWIWSTEGTTYQIELRHGRKSGIRKIYINKRLVERVKTLKDFFSDIGSVHEFSLEGRRIAQLHIVPKGFSGFTYQAS